MSYEIARKYFPAGRSNYINVYINGTHLGLYTSDQDVDKFFMRTHFGGDENMRVKGEIAEGVPPGEMGGVWEYFGSDSSDYFDKYALESNFGWNELVAFLDTLNNETEYVEDVLNIDRHLWFLAFQNLLVNLDGPINNPQNYYLYKDDNGRMNPIPWDLNESFGVFAMLQSGGPQSPTQLQQLDPFVNLNNSEYPIITKVLNDARSRKMYVAHMKTMITENFSNDWYYQRALEIQSIIDADVQADGNKFYTYANFIANVNSSVGGGPNSIIGITQLMEARINYLSSYTDFQYTAPSFNDVSYTPEQVSPSTEVWFNADVENASEAFLNYRYDSYGRFESIPMFDDGNHEDGAANDGVFGISLILGYTDLEYYVLAENQNAVTFSPARAEYEFYHISVTGDLVINEFMADNENTIADQDGDFDDWIEFYNNGTTDLNLQGYFLSDDASEPNKWEFPDTTIFAGGYLVVWADNDVDQIGLHANFKLSTSGEAIILSNASLSIIDQITFLQQKTDTTSGRYPNGTGDFAEMLPSFASENNPMVIGLTDDFESFSPATELYQNYPNPFCDYTNIGFSLKEDGIVLLQVINLYGQVVENIESAYLNQGDYLYQWNSSEQAPGVYLYNLQFQEKSMVKKMLLKK